MIPVPAFFAQYQARVEGELRRLVPERRAVLTPFE